MTRNQQYEFALALLDFCENDLSTENVNKYFSLHAPGFTSTERNSIMLTALSLLCNG